MTPPPPAPSLLSLTSTGLGQWIGTFDGDISLFDFASGTLDTDGNIEPFDTILTTTTVQWTNTGTGPGNPYSLSGVPGMPTQTGTTS